MTDRRKPKFLKNQTTKSKFSVEDYLDKADEFVEQMNAELAEKFYQRALNVDPNNLRGLDSYSQLLLELGDFEKARELIGKSIQLAPDENFTKYMNLGQISQAKEALVAYQKGISLMQQSQQQIPEGSQDYRLLRQQLSSAYCTVAELFLTDCCMEDNAEKECQQAAESAIECDPENPEGYATLANCRISQQMPEEALNLLNKCYDLWRDAEPEERPAYEFRHDVAKRFLELDQPRIAAEIWDMLLEENDTIAEVHYFIGLAYRKFDSKSSREALERAIQLLKQCSDVPFMKEVEEIYSEVLNENIIDDQAELEVDQNLEETNFENEEADDQMDM